jgi:hypothetical protein
VKLDVATEEIKLALDRGALGLILRADAAIEHEGLRR